MDFACHGVHAAGFHEVYAAESEEEDEDEPEKNSTYGLDSIVEGVFISQNTQTEVEKLGTSFEVVLVGQRMGRRELASELDFSDQGAREVEKLQDKSIGISEEQLPMSDEDYNTLLKIVEAEVCPDHIHMLVEIPPKYTVSSFMGYLKGKSSLMLYEKFPELKFKYRNREFWCRGYYVDTAGKNDKKIAEYIRHQLEEDQAGEQLTMGNF